MGRGETVASAIERSGLGAVLARVPTWRGVLVLGYHRIGAPGPGAHDTALWSATQDEFDRQLSFLKRRADVVSGDDLPAALEARRGRHVALTFDDGYRDNHDLAYPVLRANGLPAVFFLTTGFLDRPRVAWWDEIAWMVRSSPHGELEPGTGSALPAPRRPSARGSGPDPCQRLRAPRRVRHRGLPRLARPGVGLRTGRPGAGGLDVDDVGHGPRDAARRDGLRRAHRRPPGARALLGRAPAPRDRGLGGPDSRRAGRGPDAAQLSHRLAHILRRAYARVRAEAGITHAFSFYGGYQRTGRLDPLDIPRTFVGPSRSPARFRAGVTLPQLFARPIASVAAPDRPPRPPRRRASAGAGWCGTESCGRSRPSARARR